MKFSLRVMYAISIVAIIFFNSVSHMSAAPSAPSHQMSGVAHDSDNSAMCISLCRTALVGKENVDTVRSEDDEDESLPTHFLERPSHLRVFSEKELRLRLYADTQKPPPRVPVYIIHAVFRV